MVLIARVYLLREEAQGNRDPPTTLAGFVRSMETIQILAETFRDMYLRRGEAKDKIDVLVDEMRRFSCFARQVCACTCSVAVIFSHCLSQHRWDLALDFQMLRQCPYASTLRLMRFLLERCADASCALVLWLNILPLF